jgi:hypothetical protein
VFKNSLESDRGRSSIIDEINGEIKSHNELWPDVWLRTTEHLNSCYLNEDVPSEQDIISLCYINENNVETCQQIPIMIGSQQFRALIDTGCQCSIIAGELYNDFKA